MTGFVVRLKIRKSLCFIVLCALSLSLSRLSPVGMGSHSHDPAGYDVSRFASRGLRACLGGTTEQAD